MTPTAPRRGLRMTTLLMLMVLSIVACSLIFCAVLFIRQYQTATVQSAKTGGEQAVAQVTNTVSSYVSDMDEVMALLVQAMDADERRDEFFDAFLRIRPDVVAVTAYSGGGELLHCWARGQTLRSPIIRNLSFDVNLTAPGVNRYVSAPHVDTIFEGYYPWVVTLVNRVDGAGGVRWVALDLSFSGISDYISNVGIGQHGYCFLMNDGGSIVYHPQQQLIYAGLKTEATASLVSLSDGSYANDSVIYSIRTVSGSDWRVVGVSFVNEVVDSSVAAMGHILAVIVLIVLAVTAVCALLVSNLLSRPLRQLSAGMAEFERNADGYTYHPPVHGFREVRALSASFGHMVGKIQQLMAKVREEEVDLRKTELKALQAQINPHFLYNTLDSIAWMCEQGRNADAVQMVHALATLFRISISKGHELIPISREIEHAESYLQIQKFRYKNQFTYSFDVEPDCREFLCNKITLQPIIENAIYHGLDLLVEEGRIDVQVYQEQGDVVFTVTDNGVGMTQEQADSMLRREPSDRTGIGIKNVNDRLRIYFGEGYGLRITSELDVGTRVEIRMPPVREERL